MLQTGNDDKIDSMIDLALLEDSGLGDLTSDAIFSDDETGTAEIVCRERGVVAGLEVAARVFQSCDNNAGVDAFVSDGSLARPGQVLARMKGSVKGILRAERVALNILQRMSGIATLTRAYVEAVVGTSVRIADTRKTAPGLRLFDKWAVRLGGGINHRFGLDDMILIKDNHIVAAGSVTKAIEACKAYVGVRNLAVALEVETKTLAEVREAMQCGGLSRIMLDNFSVEEMKLAVELIAHRVEVEASGGVSLQNVRLFAETGVDLISVGALTHSAKALDISLDLSRIPT